MDTLVILFLSGQDCVWNVSLLLKLFKVYEDHSFNTALQELSMIINIHNQSACLEEKKLQYMDLE